MGGREELLGIGYLFRNYNAPFLTMNSPWFTYLQFYSPLFFMEAQAQPLGIIT